ncbi:MAG: hypothetical protein CGW95_17070, partial [Phenylobacterium zucineum]
QAWALLIEAKAKRARAGFGYTFGDAVDKYVTEVSSKKDGKVFEERRLAAAKLHFGAETPLAEIDTPQIAAWRDKRLETVSGSTVVREANILRNLFRVAKQEWKWMEHLPFEGVKLPEESQPRQAVWTWKLIKRVLRAKRTGKTAEVQAAFHIALRTAMRLGEVLAAPQNYNPATRLVTLNNVAGARKTDAVARVPVGRKADKLLQRPAFTVDSNEASVLFSGLCKELLITGLTFHDTRATALTHLSKKLPVMDLAKVSRHKDLSLLMNTYYRPTLSSIAMSI